MTITKQRQLAPRIYEMTLAGDLVQEMDKSGQFLHIRVPRADMLLRRPISINVIDKKAGTCRIIYRTEGAGTRIFAELQAEDRLDVLGPLGNGFDLTGIQAGEQVYIIGGGIGIPPLYELSRRILALGAVPIHFLGFANSEVMYYTEEFKALGDCRFATDDGSFGLHGNVGNLLLNALAEADYQKNPPAAVFACGNNGLLKTVDQLFSDHPNAQISLESRMACGVGACYACVCHVADDETGQKSVKVCDQGPIFPVGKVVI